MDELAPVIAHDPDGILVCGGNPSKAMEYQRRGEIMSQEGWNHRSQYEDKKLLENHLSGREPLVHVGTCAGNPGTQAGPTQFFFVKHLATNAFVKRLRTEQAFLGSSGTGKSAGTL
eukprot:242869-Alexandrium_andersonii.AAC.1